MPAFPIRIRRAGVAQVVVGTVCLSLVLLYNFRSTPGYDSTTDPVTNVDSGGKVTVTAPPASAVPVPWDTSPKSSRPGKELVVASLKGDDVSWLYDNITEWTKNIYVVNDPSAKLTVPINKGRESMVYLTYDMSLHPPSHSQFHLPVTRYVGPAPFIGSRQADP